MVLGARADIATTERPRALRAPTAAAALSIALVVAFWLDQRARVPTGVGPDPLPELWVLDGAAPRWWHFVSYAFVHENAAHLRGNVVPVGAALALVELRWGALRSGAAALAITAAASLGFHVLDGRDLYGASDLAAGLVALAGASSLAAPARAPVERLAGAALAGWYFGRTQLLPWLAGRPDPAWHVHAPGAVCGLVLGVAAAVVARRR